MSICTYIYNINVYIYIYYPPLYYLFFFPGGSLHLLKIGILQKSSRQRWGSRGMIWGQEKNIIPKKAQIFFPESFLTYSDRKSISVCCDWGGVDLSVCVCKASGNQSWMTLITGKFVEFPRLVARNLNMYQAPNLNGIARRYIVRPQEKKTQKRYWPFFSEYCRPSPGNEGSKP